MTLFSLASFTKLKYLSERFVAKTTSLSTFPKIKVLHLAAASASCKWSFSL
eukprot:CAMPEP_0114693084 /NCGR_PEP_ID=MMETSP0191-20121206/68669_1 /TAXON_ID=126664 /ORGANISM="Sorites sp." /LENGTH=50 /DNA_ID=CAMNT_0001986303 /DNA_START=132 /DNA_END=284 /DNA_ORIENTATION=+